MYNILNCKKVKLLWQLWIYFFTSGFICSRIKILMSALWELQNLDMFFRLSLSLGLGLVVGLERAAAGKTAGGRTYALVSMGAALFAIISTMVSQLYVGVNVDPLRMAAQVIVGIGFLGAGMIIFKEKKVSGLTTAAGLWVSSGVGLAVGYGFYPIAVYATLLTLITFTVMWYLGEKIGI